MPQAAEPELFEHPSLVSFALAVLCTPAAEEKAALTRRALAAWRTGRLPVRREAGEALPPDKPARDGRVRLCTPAEAPKRGRGGSLASRCALLHSLAHIESWAVDLSWDIIARFHTVPGLGELPRAFLEDWAVVAEEEAAHHEALCERLRANGSEYGALPAHDGLWQSAGATAQSLAARLAVEHCVHEARGLDVLPTTIARFRSGGDEATAQLLEKIILPQEIEHCGKGVRWFRWLALQMDPEAGPEAVAASFREQVGLHFRGALKPPFNEAARAQAGFSPEWYAPQVADA